MPAKNAKQAESSPVEKEKRYSRQNSKSKDSSADTMSNKSSRTYSRQSSKSSTCSEDAATTERKRGANSVRGNLVSTYTISKKLADLNSYIAITE